MGSEPQVLPAFVTAFLQQYKVGEQRRYKYKPNMIQPLIITQVKKRRKKMCQKIQTT